MKLWKAAPSFAVLFCSLSNRNDEGRGKEMLSSLVLQGRKSMDGYGNRNGSRPDHRLRDRWFTDERDLAKSRSISCTK